MVGGGDGPEAASSGRAYAPSGMGAHLSRLALGPNDLSGCLCEGVAARDSLIAQPRGLHEKDRHATRANGARSPVGEEDQSQGHKVQT
jgi:hypothetical protein